MQRRGDLLDEVAGFLLDLLDVQRAQALDERQHRSLHIVHLNKRLAIERGKQRQILRDNPANISAGEAALHQGAVRQALPVVGDVIKACAEGQFRRLPEAVPVEVQPRLHVPVERVIFIHTDGFQQLLPLHPQPQELPIHLHPPFFKPSVYFAISL